MSAATFLGITGLTYLAGLDAAIYVLAPMVGFCILLTLMVEPFRKLGRFTVSDVAAHRFEKKSVRVFAALTSLVSCSSISSPDGRSRGARRASLRDLLRPAVVVISVDGRLRFGGR
jgi:Na+/pantothenate symporter